ncbi:MAG: glycosyltransferase [Gammaproteobacteria bacterium]|nr:MAG: glycosyltransferase [Gammaproteobacteria bacterium]
MFDPDKVDADFIADFRNRHRLTGKKVITTVGRITQLKDHQTFIRAIGILAEQGHDVVGLVVGGVRDDKRGYFDGLKRLTAELGLTDRIVFAGSQRKMAEIYALSDVVVSSSKKPESFGRTAAEALAMNTPVVATRHGGVLDIVIDRENGFLIEIQDPVALADAVLESVSLAKDNLRKHILDNFSLGKMVEETILLYRSEVRLK